MNTLQETLTRTRGPEVGLRRPITFPWVLLAATAGGFVFLTIQALAGLPLHIAEFMGAQIVRRGGYPAALTAPIGWGVHFGVSLAYAALFALILHLPGFPTTARARTALAAFVAAGLGWITTLIAPPAIAITIGVLAGQGVPDSIPGLNAVAGIPLWTHLAFFVSCWVVLLVARPLADRRSG